MKIALWREVVGWLDKVRTGWKNRNVAKDIAETVWEHSKKVAKAAWIYGVHFSDIDLDKLIKIWKIHDLAEYKEKDYTPGEISKDEKYKREKAVIISLKDKMWLEEWTALWDLWDEYEKQETKEAQIIKWLDKMDAAVQAIEYEKKWYKNMIDFYDDTLGKLKDPTLIKILNILLKNKFVIDVDIYEQYFFLLKVNWDEEKYNKMFLGK